MNFVLFIKPFGSAFLLPLPFHLSLSFATLCVHFKIAWTSLLASPCNTAFALLPREQVRLLDESVVEHLCKLDQKFVGQLHLGGTVDEVLTHHIQYHISSLDPHVTKVDSSYGQTTVWIHSSTSAQPGLSIPNGRRLRS